MWRSIGSVASSDKHNKSREENNYQAFAQASRLRLNQSQLSGEAPPPQFLNQYFVKKRSPEGLLQRVLSHKNIQSRPFVSPPSSMKDVGSPRIRQKSQPNETVIKGASTVNNDKNSIDEQVINNQKQAKKQKEDKCERLREQLKIIKNEQTNINKSMTGQFTSFKKQMKEVEEQIQTYLQQVEAQKQKQKKESFNPQLLNKLRQESSKFSQRMKEMDLKKQQVKQKYRSRLEKL